MYAVAYWCFYEGHSSENSLPTRDAVTVCSWGEESPCKYTDTGNVQGVSYLCVPSRNRLECVYMLNYESFTLTTLDV